MRILHQYKVTTNVLPRFRRLVGYEEKYCAGVHDGIDRLIITDKETPIELPASWSQAVVIRRELTIDGIFNESKTRNHGMRFALDNGYDYLLDGDCDRVLLEMPADKICTGFDVSNVPYYACKEFETDEELNASNRAGQMRVSGASWFVISRAAFSIVRFHEGFKFNRFEDLDFFFTVCPSYGLKIDTRELSGVGKGIHLWHSDSERGMAYEKANSGLYRERQTLYSRLKSERGGVLPGTVPEECP